MSCAGFLIMRHCVGGYIGPDLFLSLWVCTKSLTSLWPEERGGGIRLRGLPNICPTSKDCSGCSTTSILPQKYYFHSGVSVTAIATAYTDETETY